MTEKLGIAKKVMSIAATAAVGASYAVFKLSEPAPEPMGFKFEKEEVGDVPQMAEEFVPVLVGERR